jgi:hypothetical protein
MLAEAANLPVLNVTLGRRQAALGRCHVTRSNFGKADPQCTHSVQKSTQSIRNVLISN